MSGGETVVKGMTDDDARMRADVKSGAVLPVVMRLDSVRRRITEAYAHNQKGVWMLLEARHDLEQERIYAQHYFDDVFGKDVVTVERSMHRPMMLDVTATFPTL